MQEIRCAIKIEDRAEGEPPRLVGTLLPFNERASDRAEIFEPGSLTWPSRALCSTVNIRGQLQSCGSSQLSRTAS